jgi:hypothetical protein
MDAQKAAASPTPASVDPSGVRFLLSELLDELEVERASGTQGMERLGRLEIRKLVKEKGDRRVRSSK